MQTSRVHYMQPSEGNSLGGSALRPYWSIHSSHPQLCSSGVIALTSSDFPLRPSNSLGWKSDLQARVINCTYSSHSSLVVKYLPSPP